MYQHISAIYTRIIIASWCLQLYFQPTYTLITWNSSLFYTRVIRVTQVKESIWRKGQWHSHWGQEECSLDSKKIATNWVGGKRENLEKEKNWEEKTHNFERFLPLLTDKASYRQYYGKDLSHMILCSSKSTPYPKSPCLCCCCKPYTLARGSSRAYMSQLYI